jgi:hypothetical protein
MDFGIVCRKLRDCFPANLALQRIRFQCLRQRVVGVWRWQGVRIEAEVLCERVGELGGVFDRLACALAEKGCHGLSNVSGCCLRGWKNGADVTYVSGVAEKRYTATGHRRERDFLEDVACDDSFRFIHN